MIRRLFWILSTTAFLFVLSLAFESKEFLWLLIIIIPFFVLGIYDMIQKRKNILRLYPVVGHLRYIFQAIRPQIQQYFIESATNGTPFSREERELVYHRTRKINDNLPFGTQRDVHSLGFDSMTHSMSPKKVDVSESRILVGNSQCKQPYLASRLNVSALSYGAISKNAVRALNRGAKFGGFAHNTGEGGLSPYHLEEGGDIVWQLGTAYFGCRKKNGDFDPILFHERANLPQVKMIEIKISQGAKPAHGGILPASKVNLEIANIRGINMDEDCISPPAHSTFSTPLGLLEFITQLRELSKGKPIGFKLCIGNRHEFLGICKAMIKTGIYPDFITIDGAEGGSGAAPLEFCNFVGLPLVEGLLFAHNALVGTSLREHIRLIASGKIISGFDMICKIALGADICNSARGMMFALGCVQSLRCHTNMCPTGVATQDPERTLALDVDDKSIRVKNYQEATVKSFLELLGAAGLEKVSELTAGYIYHRTSPAEMKHYNEIFTFLNPGQLFTDKLPYEFQKAWELASEEKF